MTDAPEKPPFEHFYDLHDLTEAGSDVRIAATAEQRAALAAWVEVDAVESFEAIVTLVKRSPTRFSYDAKLTADVVQACVVTLEPVHSHIETTVTRALHLNVVRRGGRHERSDSDYLPPALTAKPDGDDLPEEITNPHYDLAAPLLEEFSLSIDPYPRAPGVEFRSAPESGPESGKPESPFAVLGKLKIKGR